MNYSVAGRSIGLPAQLLRRAAGAYRKYVTHTFEPGWGTPFDIEGDFGDQHRDQVQIIRGIEYVDWGQLVRDFLDYGWPVGPLDQVILKDAPRPKEIERGSWCIMARIQASAVGGLATICQEQGMPSGTMPIAFLTLERPSRRVGVERSARGAALDGRMCPRGL